MSSEKQDQPLPHQDHEHIPLTRRLRNFFITTFLGGLIVILPITLFILLIRFLFNLVVGVIDPLARLLFPAQDFADTQNRALIGLLSLAIVVTFCFLVGLVLKTQAGKALWGWIETGLLEKLPIYSTIRETVQQFTGKSREHFSRVVIVDPFGNGTRMTGFVTDTHENGMVTVFVPTAPNPTNGFVFHLDPECVTYTEVGTEEAMRSIIAVGNGSAKVLSKEKPRTIRKPITPPPD